MRVLLDECLPRKLGRWLIGHEVSTVPQAGWAGLVNGQLLARITGHFDAFVTVDQNLPAQQHTGNLDFGVIVLRAPTNRLSDLVPLVPEVLVTLTTLRPAQVVVIESVR
jgi:hypothetical protein